MSVVRFPSPDTIESHAELMRQASMEPKKTLDKALSAVHESAEQCRALRERMMERLQQLEANFQSSMGRLTQLNLKLDEIEAKEGQVQNLIDKCEKHIRKLKNQPEKKETTPSWLSSRNQSSLIDHRMMDSGKTSSLETSVSQKDAPLIDREKELRDTVQKMTEASMAKEKLAVQKKEIRIAIDKEDAVKEYFLTRIKRIQEPLKSMEQVTSSIETDLNSSEEAAHTAEQLAERLLWLGMKLSQLSDAVEDLRRDVP